MHKAMWNFLNFASTKKDNTATPSGVIHIKTEKNLRNLYRKEISHWRNARASRHHPECPSTHSLQDVYADAMIDGHLTAVVNNRILYVQNKKYVIKDRTNKVDAEKTKLIEQGWFREVVRYAMESIFYGYSLIWIKSFRGNRISSVELVDRRHVIPERGTIVQNVYDKEGVAFAQYPHHLLYAQFDNPIGLLEKAAPLTILKRHSWANWDEFEQLFGIPIRIAKVPNLEADGVRQVENWLDQMGTAAYAILPTSADIEIKDGNRSDAHQVFSEKVKIVNAELSKLINGQTMTVDSGSSRSQSEVHERTQQEIRKADMDNFLWWSNNVLMPALSFHGYPFSLDDRIDQIESTLPSERIRIDEVLLRSGVKLSKKYLEDTYNVSIEEDATQVTAKALPQPSARPDDRVFAHEASTQQYATRPGDEEEEEEPEQDERSEALEFYRQQIQDFSKAIRRSIFLYPGEGLQESRRDEYYVRIIRSEVMSHVFSHVYRGIEEKGVGVRLAHAAFDSANYRLLKELRTNAGVFFAFKYHRLTQESVKLLTDEKGRLRTAGEFSRALRKINVKHNKELLKQEYNQAISTAVSAKKWHDYQGTKHLYPNLRYVAQIDGLTRQSHRELHNKVFPIGHAFWDTHYPPNGWNCRCSVEATDALPTERADEITKQTPPVQEPFNFNPGKEGKITTDSHLYFKLPKKEYQEVLNVARHAIQSHNKREVFSIMRVKKFSPMSHDGAGFTVEALSRSKMRNILNQPHDHKYEKDTMLYNLKRIFSNSTYLGGVRNKAGKNKRTISAYHYFSFRSKRSPEKNFFFNVREYSNGKYRLHSITDHLRGYPKKKEGRQ